MKTDYKDYNKTENKESHCDQAGIACEPCDKALVDNAARNINSKDKAPLAVDLERCKPCDGSCVKTNTLSDKDLGFAGLVAIDATLIYREFGDNLDEVVSYHIGQFIELSVVLIFNKWTQEFAHAVYSFHNQYKDKASTPDGDLISYEGFLDSLKSVVKSYLNGEKCSLGDAINLRGMLEHSGWYKYPPSFFDKSIGEFAAYYGIDLVALYDFNMISHVLRDAIEKYYMQIRNRRNLTDLPALKVAFGLANQRYREDIQCFEVFDKLMQLMFEYKILTAYDFDNSEDFKRTQPTVK